MKIRVFILTSFLAITTISCTYDSEGDFTDIPDEPEQNDSGNLVTYVGDIQPLIQNSCVSCHGSPPTNGAPFSLTNYNEVSGRATLVLAAMARQNGTPGVMPPSGRLPQATVNLVEQWIADGTPEN